MKYIKNQTTLFSYIDPDFNNWDVDEGVETAAKSFNPVDLKTDSTFKQMFASDTDCMSQGDVITWVTENKAAILKSGKYYFFLLKNKKGEKFVARVFKVGGRLEVSVNEFSHGSVWYAKCGRVFILPQHDTLSPSPLTPGNLGSLTLERAIQVCKDAGLTVTKIY